MYENESLDTCITSITDSEWMIGYHRVICLLLLGAPV